MAAIAGVCVSLATTPIAPAQAPAAPAPSPRPAEPEGPFELRPIRAITVREPVPVEPGADPATPRTYRPVDRAMEQLVRNQLRTLEGRPFRTPTVQEDVARLNRLGIFRTIDSLVKLEPDGSVEVVFTVVRQPLIEDVQVVGNREISDQDLLRAVTLQAGMPIDRFQIDRSARAIEGLYRARGFYNVSVRVDEEELAESSIVVFRVVEGRPVRVTGVQFEGNNSFTRQELLSAVRTAVYIPVLERGPLNDDTLRDDTNALAEFYKNRGYLDVRTSVRVQPAPNGREALVVFQVDEGPLYTLRRVEVYYATQEAVDEYRVRVLNNPRAEISYLTPEQMRQIGRRPFSREQIVGLMPIKPGDVYNQRGVRDGVRAIEEAYGKLGFIIEDRAFETATVRVAPREVRDENRPEVDLILFITEGTPVRTGQIVVGGNEITKQQVILRQLDIKPERPLDYAALQESQRRLENLRLFFPGSVRLRVLPEDRRQPGQRDVYVEVRETNTGEFNIGAAVNSDSGLVGQISLVQRNFDLYDTPESFGELFSGRAFRGAGQRFELSAQPGTEFQDYRLSLTEPYFLETDYSAGGSVFYRNREFREYTEERYGGTLSIGRRFGPVWEGTLQLRNEWVRLSDFDANGPQDYFDASGRSRLTGLGLVLARTTTNDRFRPSRGSRLELGAERVGLFGEEFQFTKLRGSYTVFLNVYESFLGYKTILKLNTEVAWIPEGQSAAPVYERWYLGGRSFRGFGTRAVSPIGRRRDGSLSNDPVGGAFLFFAGAEIQQPVYRDIISVVGFLDTGTVDTDPSLDKYRVSIGTGIRLFVPQLSPVPLAFDFGVPLIRQSTDRRRIFTFSIDIPF